MMQASTLKYGLFASLALATFCGTVPARAQTAPAAPVAAEPEAAPAPVVSAPSAPAVKPPEPPKPTGPTYNPPPPSGKDWGKLPQESREQILNEWKALSEKDREPFIFYRERAMAKLPDSAYSDNPYKPDAPEAAAPAGKAASPTAAASSTSRAAASEEKVEEKSSSGFFDKIMGKDGAPATE